MSNELVTKAKFAEHAERYDDMVTYMTQYVKDKGEVTDDVRNLLSVAYKNKIGSRRTSWRFLSGEEQRLIERQSDEQSIMILREYKKTIENELINIHDDVMDLIDNYLLKQSNDTTERKVFYYKMKGDYCRYKAEFSEGDARKDAAKESLKAYETAEEIAKDLDSTHATRLGLSLNFSVFYYEIQNDPQEACRVAKEAFDNAISHLDSVPEDTYKDSTLIMQLLRDNLTLWTSDAKDVEDVEDEKQ